jgi:peptidyl-prolyl cis-trans isomerase B (cyclophilin B)
MTTFSKEARAILKTSMGDIALEFLDDKAPRTCEHFVKLARQGFYDGLTFHRVLKGFVIQGGCPKGDGTGGPGFTIRAEFNDTPHVRGTVSMAHGSDPHSAGSQFFICVADARYLDSRFTAFARVIEGEAVLDKIANVPVTENRWKELSTPREPVFINRIELEGIEFDAEDPPQSAAPQQPQQQAPRHAPHAPPPKELDDGEDADEDEVDDEDEPQGADEPPPPAAEDEEPNAEPPASAEEEEESGGTEGSPAPPPAGGKPEGSRPRRRRGGRRRRKS